jgi:hypothetical protein
MKIYDLWIYTNAAGDISERIQAYRADFSIAGTDESSIWVCPVSMTKTRRAWNLLCDSFPNPRPLA